MLFQSHCHQDISWCDHAIDLVLTSQLVEEYWKEDGQGHLRWFRCGSYVKNEIIYKDTKAIRGDE